MPRVPFSQLSAILLALLPAPALAQAAAKAPLLSAGNTWRALQVICWNKAGCVSPRIGAAVQLVGPNTGENDVLDGVAYNGYANAIMERWDSTVGVSWNPVLSGEILGGYFTAAYNGSHSDPVAAGIYSIATETWSATHNGGDLVLSYKANATTNLAIGATVSPQGKGGFVVGDPTRWGAIADLGNGTIDAADSIATKNHLRTTGAHGTVTACGTSPTFNGGTDQAGQIRTGGAVAACTYTFAKTWGASPICMVQVFNAAAPTAFISSQSASAITVSFSASFRGTFQYMCMGVS